MILILGMRAFGLRSRGWWGGGGWWFGGLRGGVGGEKGKRDR